MFRAPPLVIPQPPEVKPLMDRIALTMVTTPSPPAVKLPPEGLEGWYATLPPGLPGAKWEHYHFIRCLGGPEPCPYTLPPKVLPPTTTAALGPEPAPAPAPAAR